ncbi:MAG: hypothetical protein HY741_19930 [Chloroflexi bacterium]|nr:hypothetical protein [Chloroflexota bacterium]
METITIRVVPEAAKAYTAASPDEQRKLEALLSIWLIQALKTNDSLEEIMREMSHHAQARGLTPEILETLLHEE